MGRVVDALHLKLTTNLDPLSHLKAEIRSLELKLEEKKEIWKSKRETSMEERGLAIHELSKIEKEINLLKPKGPQDFNTVIHFDSEKAVHCLLDLIIIEDRNDSEHLFQLKQCTKRLTVFNIPEKKFTDIELDFVIPSCPGFCHIKNEFYLAGGSDFFSLNRLNDFRRISHSGKVVKLKSLPTKKSLFPMTYWEREDIIITLGGYDGSSRLTEVQQFMIGKNKWKALPSLPEQIDASSATVLNDVLYNIGGDRSTNSVYWLDLLKPKWNSLKTLGQTHFSGHYWRDATVVKNKIVYFGSYWKDKATYVLEEEKGEPRNLEVKSRFAPIDY